MNSKTKPNILLILTDQQSINTLKCYGESICNTPNLDNLAHDGIIFDNAYTVCPICTPARASLQTGLYPFKHGMPNNIYTTGNTYQELPDSPYLLSRKLQSQGYSIGYTGKWHLGFGNKSYENPNEYSRMLNQFYFDDSYCYGNALPTTLGYEGDDFPGHGGGGHQYPDFKEYLNKNGLVNSHINPVKVNGRARAAEVDAPIEATISYYLVEKSIEQIKKFNKREKPFFFSLNFWGPHEPYFAQEKYIDMYRNISIKPWESFLEDGSNKPSIHEVKRQLKGVEWETFEELLRHYYALTSEIDGQIGRLMDYLKQNNLYDNTVIIFSADHGESLGIHGGLMDKSFFMYDETCKIPLIIKPQGSAEGRHDTRFINTCDLYSTILELSGISREESQRDGSSLVPLINNETDIKWRDCVVTVSSGLESILFTQRMIRKEDIKYVFNCGDIDELYDLKNDPSEKENLVNSQIHKQLLLDMRRLLHKWMKDNGDSTYKQFEILRNMK